MPRGFSGAGGGAPRAARGAAGVGRPRGADPFTKPILDQFQMTDPRDPSKAVPIIAFYFPGHEEIWDRHCQAIFLGNFFELEEPILIHPAGKPQEGMPFTNTEAGFQALKFWKHAPQFASKSGHEAFALKKQLKGSEDFSYSGYGSNWRAMEHVLRQKFVAGSKCARHLCLTQDAFLLEHNSVSGRDSTWSDNYNGDGQNWLGLQLMMIRDELSGHTSRGSWTCYAREHINLATGAAHSEEWQNTVKQACMEVHSKWPTCGCGKPTWNGQWNELCSRSCPGPRKEDPSASESLFGMVGNVVRGGMGFLFGEGSDPATLHAPNTRGDKPICGCGKPTWNGQWNELCKKSCPGPRVLPSQGRR
eukprot:TRINITY_DN194_c0_g2_i4.p1 TRINITY_DN194_c0_g2~~TRINITY_DN194_c0_g2_i4.p1  ORF type:complete len:361 (+),score=45.84 TRINITY_DN194_c0_g2_i4:49-1131(+)